MARRRNVVSVVACPQCGMRHRNDNSKRSGGGTVCSCGLSIQMRCRHCPRFAVALLPADNAIFHGVCAVHRVRYTEFAAEVDLPTSARTAAENPSAGRKGRVVRKKLTEGDEPSPGQDDAIRRTEDR